MVLPVGIIGAGKVGCSLGRYLREHAPMVRWVDFASATPAHAQEAAAFCDGHACAGAAELVEGSRLVFLTVPDDAIAGLAARLAAECREAGVSLRGKVIAHCSGALASDVLAPLRETGAEVASCHPLYAVSSRFECWEELAQAWFTLEGDDAATELLEALLAGCGNHVVRIPAEQKARYHAAAVMASNLVVGLYDQAAGQLERCGFERADAEAALAPLFLGNASHIAHDGPAASLTGPAKRGDTETIERHLSCLSGDDREVYRLLTDVLYRIAARS